ncbi:helix-turn-helix domain-containing protein [Yersinia enterocolitica]|uniref:helix-turn-helix domain-containing protein n=1 Tax=Yersiniaceae TaxID=1903411 RepID=UPI001B053F92|nr:helix-turn-helix transcriptional regulator [Yersinia intermedia]EKN3891426.1 helix-turn-helix transcriptional regulator [Yersinia enterocolitica]HBA4338105.1 helix-turn-helix transcriptional regulator [Escherichia coli]HBE9082586.1 helix-turn-helix transcriptional regulator [Serratia fonticola]EKN3944431.1 helix-turn-helix transcriptional regulator [Yersinia enterocolitica]EKN4176348.1 helix-turn-helix transcriptional regulator [Yersinia enterocolitica]
MIYRALKTIRLYHNIKQSELAEIFGMSKSYLSEIESGKKTVSFDILESYSKQFEIPVSSLIFFSEELNSPSKKSVAEKFRLVFADKILKIMEWSVERNEEKEAEN